MVMKKVTIAEALAEFRAQGVGKRDYAAVCPICGTVQSMASLVRAGADPKTVEQYFAFSCEGRFSGSGPWPSDRDKSAKAVARRAERGCDWTLGGLFTVHRLEIVFPDGRQRPSFEIATATQAKELAAC